MQYKTQKAFCTVETTNVLKMKTVSTPQICCEVRMLKYHFSDQHVTKGQDHITVDSSPRE